MKTTMLLFWVATPCELIGRYRRFGGTSVRKFILPLLCLAVHFRSRADGSFIFLSSKKYLRYNKKLLFRPKCITRSAIILHFAKYYEDNVMKEDEMGRECGMHKVNNKCIQFWPENLIGRVCMRRLGIDGRIILKRILMWNGLDSSRFEF